MRRALVLPFSSSPRGRSRACSSDDTKGAIDVTADQRQVRGSPRQTSGGKSTFAVKNDGDDVTEVYVYAKGDEVKGEVENIGPGHLPQPHRRPHRRRVRGRLQAGDEGRRHPHEDHGDRRGRDATSESRRRR